MRNVIVLVLMLLSRVARAGGPAYVAGASYFDPSVKGAPLIWPQGSISYSTDQGNLSAILPSSSADYFVASAFSLWTSLPTAAVTATQAGNLSEDVNGTNVTSAAGIISMPADILPSATQTPVAIVYDNDGSVTDALLGAGASNVASCANNGAYGGIDAFGTTGQFQHALIILNGLCAASSSQLPDLQYHLVRVMGRVLGLDWSQANLNVITRTPPPTTADFAGFPVMHEFDSPACVPVSACYSNHGAVNPAQPKFDDAAALSRLYPVTTQNLGSYPGKRIFQQTTARIHGSVYFSGSSGQPMQGVNVVAHWINPGTAMPQGDYVVSSISGFLFCGNAGNVVSGYVDSSGQSFNRFGSDDTTLQGFFDLAGLPVPNGSSVQYQITVEPVDPLWSQNAGPYGSTSQVKPSGTAQPLIVTVTPGSDVQQDIVMQGSATPTQPWYAPTSYSAPAQVPSNGNWNGNLTGYGTTDYFQFNGQANRTLSVIVNALDETGVLSQSKAMPVIGLWSMANPGQTPAPAYTPFSFNSTVSGETRLDAQILQSTAFRLGISDFRGDGRPDFRYNARIFYGDSIAPTRASVAGGTPLILRGLGLQSDTAIQVGNAAVPVLASSASQLLLNTTAASDGVYDLLLSDSRTGASSQMTAVLTIGAGPADTLKLISGSGPAVAVGGQASAPFAVTVVAADGVTAVPGATVQFSSSPAVGFSACNGAGSCTVVSDQSGMASTQTTVLSAGVITLNATLAPASYQNPSQVQTTLLGVSSSLDLSAISPSVWVAQGATVSIPLNVRVLSNGTPVSGATVNYQTTQGSGILSSATAQTNASGMGSVTLQLTAVSTGAQVSACVAPSNSPCQTFKIFAVATSSLRLQAVARTQQVVASGQNLQPVTLRVVDSAVPAHAVLGASVFFQSYAGRLPGNGTTLWAGETQITHPTMPIILASSQATVQSDASGTALFPMSTGSLSGNVAVLGSATVGGATLSFMAERLAP